MQTMFKVRGGRAFRNGQNPGDQPALVALTLPVSAFDMIVHAYRQTVAAFLAAAFQDFATFGGSHAGSKAMHAQPTADFRLVSSFWHSTSWI